MTQAVSLPIPCFGTSLPHCYHALERTSLVDAKIKVAFIFSAFLAVVGFALLPSLAHVGVTCLVVAGLGMLAVAQLVSHRRQDFVTKKLETLESAKQLAVGITISPALQKELVETIPVVDTMQTDDRIASVDYHSVDHHLSAQAATFRLKTAPHLQFTISPPLEKWGSCKEFPLAFRYENRIYAHEICQRENYGSLVVPSMKPLYLKVGGSHRLVLAETVVQKESKGNLERAVRQMVQFLLKTGGNDFNAVPFVPMAGGKLALENLQHLTSNPHPDVQVRESVQIHSVLGNKDSFLGSLDRKDLIDIALNEFKHQRLAQDPSDLRAERIREIQRAKQARLDELNKSAQVMAARKSPRNILGITPEELGLDLNAKDFVTDEKPEIPPQVGGTRHLMITLREVASSILDRINRKLELNQGQARIEFTPEELLLDGKIPVFSWPIHHRFNMMRGLGRTEWPNSNQGPPYWITLVLQALKNKGVISGFSFPKGANPTVDVNLAVLKRS